jgi:putative ABC transport system ATP-binding protein
MAMSSKASSPVRLQNVRKTYGSGEGATQALADVSIEFPAGSFTAIMGPSGSGKSTLLHCAAGLDEPTAGDVTLVGTSLRGLNETQLTRLRQDRVSFIFQSYNLMPALSVWDNVALPAILAGRRPDKTWIAEVIKRVGLSERMHHRPGQLSGGQKQRVAIARAIATQSEVTFADEPTGALDTQTAAEVLDLLRDLASLGQTVIMVTHDPSAAAYAQKVIFLVDGRIVTEMASPNSHEVSERLSQLSRDAKKQRQKARQIESV